jgi:hypothetical protein
MLTLIPDYQKRVARGLQTWWLRADGTVCCSPAYLHGKLQDLAGFDIVYHQACFMGPPVIPMLDHGHQMVRIYMDRGRFKAVMIYWWSVHDKYSPRFRALICDPKDIDAVRYAQLKRAQRAFIL